MLGGGSGEFDLVDSVMNLETDVVTVELTRILANAELCTEQKVL